VIPKLKAAWNSLPPFWKGAIVFSVTAATGVLRHAIQNPNPCFTLVCLKGYAIAAAHTGGVALIAYVMDSPFAKQLLPPTQNSNGPTPQV
jgi:hypothetical protein